AILASGGPVDARSVLDFQLADAEYRALLLNDKYFWLNGSAGLRWGHLEQEFGQSGAFTGANSGVIATQMDIDFDGGGPKFGLDGGRVIGKRGFSIYARAGVSPLAGQFRSSYDMTNTTTDVQLAQADWNDDRIVTLLDYEIGLAWTGPQRKWRFATGYTAAYWYNAVRTQDFINAVQNGEYSDVSSTISFDGLTARIERMW
ncbi:MAG TPA: Lpg1974 family pore-forming outer membrane protein, partial [Lacipirellulaceae bacterium]|nr:Lpg1974 family pore-forming outer membrane protein [Lacipirellulaceae bacterium]